MGWTNDFDTAVRQSFSFLLQLGYEATSENYDDLAASVKFARKEGYEVIVSACPVRLECDATIRSSGQYLTSLFELEAMYPAVKLPSFDCGVFAAHSDQAKLARFVSTIAERFRLLGLPVLTGEVSPLRIIEWRRGVQEKADIAVLSKRAATAFKEKHWAEVVSLVQQLGVNATNIDRKRMAIAQRNIGRIVS